MRRLASRVTLLALTSGNPSASRFCLPLAGRSLGERWDPARSDLDHRFAGHADRAWILLVDYATSPRRDQAMPADIRAASPRGAGLFAQRCPGAASVEAPRGRATANTAHVSHSPSTSRVSLDGP